MAYAELLTRVLLKEACASIFDDVINCLKIYTNNVIQLTCNDKYPKDSCYKLIVLNNCLS